MTTISFMPILALAAMDELKTQTRRHISQGLVVAGHPGIVLAPDDTIDSRRAPKWRVGQQLPIKASRTGKALSYVEINELRTEDVREIAWMDADAEACTLLYPNERYSEDPITCFWVTWIKLNTKGIREQRYLLQGVGENFRYPVDRRTYLHKRMADCIVPDVFQAHVITFTHLPDRITDAGRAFLEGSK